MHYLESGIESLESGIQAELPGILTWSEVTILSDKVETLSSVHDIDVQRNVRTINDYFNNL